MSFGIDFGSISEALWHQIPCFGVILFGMNLGIDVLSIVDQNCDPKRDGLGRMVPSFFTYFSRTLVPFAHVKPTSAKPHFPTFFKQLEEFIYTCIFYTRETYKCAMTVFMF